MWESQLIEAKLHRQAKGAKVQGHLTAYEGGRLPGGRMIGADVLTRLFARFRKPKATALRAVK